MIGRPGTMEAAGLAAETGVMKIIIVWILHLERSVFILTNPFFQNDMDAIITRSLYIFYLCCFIAECNYFHF